MDYGPWTKGNYYRINKIDYYTAYGVITTRLKRACILTIYS